jgi:hypothetical protein
MRSIRRTLRRPSLLPKTQWNRAILLRTRHAKLWKNEIRMKLKIDADALTTHLHVVLRSKNGWSYASTSPIRLHGVVLS